MATRRWEMDRQLVLLIRQCAIPETNKKNTNVNRLTLEEQVHVLSKDFMITLFLMCLKNIFSSEMFCLFDPRKYTLSRNPTVVHGVGAGVYWWNPSLEFLICCSISKRFYLQWKAFDFLEKWGQFFALWRCWRPVTSPNMVAILDFTKN